MVELIKAEVSEILKLINSLEDLRLIDISIGEFKVWDSEGDYIGDIVSDNGDYRFRYETKED